MGAVHDGLCTSRSAGTACGDQGVECLVDDACDDLGACIDNGFAAVDTACGDSTDTECSAANTCDGSGTCLDNHASDGTSCDDGLFCTTMSICTAGSCGSGAGDPCTATQMCNDEMDMCLDNCGNGSIEVPEMCDDGLDNSDTEPDACRTDCSQARCGDGVTDSDEMCDDGADNGSASSSCTAECARVPNPDGGIGGSDGGITGSDAGTAGSDGGPASGDGGVSGDDSGISGGDGGDGASGSSGCNCRVDATSGGANWIGSLLTFGWLIRRRRRT